MGTEGTRGILNPSLGLTQFTLERELPPDDLAPFVEGFWWVNWSLEQGVSPVSPCARCTGCSRATSVPDPSGS